MREGAAMQNGPLSWQQEGLLRLERNGKGYPSVWKAYEIPEFVTDEELMVRIQSMVDGEDALHIIDLTADDGGHAYYRDKFDIPVRHKSCSSFEEVRYIATSGGRSFDRGREPLWEITIYHLIDVNRRPVRYAHCVFDHMIGDGYAMRLVQERLTTAERPVERPADLYRKWVEWQSQKFPRLDSVPSKAASNFWLRHLDGTMPDRVTPLPFKGKGDASSGLMTMMAVDLPITFNALRITAGRLRATPFLLLLSSVVSQIAQVNSVRDLTLRIATSGRFRPYLQTLGWFASAFPMRICDPPLDDPQRILDVTREILGHIIPTASLAPWGYIKRICALNNQGVTEGDQRGQLMIHGSPHTTEDIFAGEQGERTTQGDVDKLHLYLSRNAQGYCRLVIVMSRQDFLIAEVRDFVESIASQLSRTVQGRVMASALLPETRRSSLK
jgi:hypothetical protein